MSRAPQTSEPVRGIHHVGVTVADLDASLRFYRDLLGMRILGLSEAEDVGAIVGVPGASARIVEGCDACELAERFGTPLYVVSEDQLRRNARRLVRAFSERWEGPVNVLPSIKANHVLALRRILSEEGLGCDTFGPGELRAALACEVPPALIVNGSGKSARLIDDAVAAGCRITLDAPRELDLAIAAARRLGRRARLRVRVRPDISALEGIPSDFSPGGGPLDRARRRRAGAGPAALALRRGDLRRAARLA